MANKKELIVSGFLFEDEESAKLAQSDMSKIKMLDSKLNYEYFDTIAMVYDKAVDKQIFNSVVGNCYLKKLQEYLIEHKDENIDYEVKPIRIRTELEKEDIQIENTEKGNNKGKFGETVTLDNGKSVKIRVGQNKELKRKLRFSVILNFLMAIIVVSLFLITLTGSNENIINYKNAIANEYAKWDEELKERESIVREKEKELEIN